MARVFVVLRPVRQAWHIFQAHLILVEGRDLSQTACANCNAAGTLARYCLQHGMAASGRGLAEENAGTREAQRMEKVCWTSRLSRQPFRWGSNESKANMAH